MANHTVTITADVENEKPIKDMEIEGRRVFQDPEKEDKNYYISAPTADDIRGADWQYSKTYTRSLVEDITTSAEMMDILRRRGVVGPEFEQRQRELADNLASKVLALQTSDSIDNKQLRAMEVANAREELFNWNQRLNGPMSNTCEQMADDARLEYLTSRMIEREDSAKLWESYDEFLKERRQALAIRSRFEVMLYLQGLESNFMENTPEAVAMKEVESELKQKATKAIEELAKQQEEKDATKEKKDIVNKPVDKPKRKRTTKKKPAVDKPTTKKSLE